MRDSLTGSSLQVHMTLNHGYPPPGSSVSSTDDKVSEVRESLGETEYQRETLTG